MRVASDLADAQVDRRERIDDRADPTARSANRDRQNQGNTLMSGEIVIDSNHLGVGASGIPTAIPGWGGPSSNLELAADA